MSMGGNEIRYGGIYLKEKKHKTWAAIPNPSGISDIEYTTTPLYWGTPSVILARPAFVTLFPYKNDISAPWKDKKLN